ncbi:hypothetical protein L1987_85287 [Smallanthus sonchifolius]|uniref:Uncharacterized protein n=1 Tax=Smallanthus sonchifolius TaxID=185202 RepID=A0ACB8Y0A5_9ASTR|nr:hypothetical protein L1987_85287 [Smallanthus sonchifolius]
MNQERPPPPPQPSATTNLTIKISNSTQKPRKEILTNIVPATSISSSPYNSPSLISPPSSAFVSALQSPYISPRATRDDTNHPQETETATATAATTPTTFTHPSTPLSYYGSDDIPSTSHTPPSERYDFSDDTKLKIVNCVPISIPSSDTNTSSNNATAPRVSFSFPIPRVSFQKGSVSPANAKLRSCDVYIGYHGQNPNLIRFCKWLKSELELQGIACFVADRAKYSDSQSHEVADRVICSVTFGVVVVTKDSLMSYLSLEEIRFFAQKKNLIPLFFDTYLNEAVNLLGQNPDSKEGKEVIDGLTKSHEFKLEANDGNWRLCVSKTAGILRGKLGRMSVAEKEIENIDEIQFTKSRFFVGREKELAEIETAFFGCWEFENENIVNVGKDRTPGTSEGLADEESEGDEGRNGKFINLEVGRCKEPKLEAWVEPVIGRNSLKRPKYKKTKSGKYKNLGSSIVCINGGPGMGKTELALEFAHRYSQRYKMVLWVGGEARYFRQNIFNLSLNLGLDISADEEKERGRIRSFDEQETEAFKRVKRELFRDMPYLLIIDNLETEKDWWEGKDLHDLIPRNTGGSHVIITTRLPRVMNFDPMQLQPLALKDAILLIKGRRKKEYPAQEIEILAKFDENLGRSSYGLSVIGSLLSELAIAPSTLFEAINHIRLEEISSHFDEVFWGNNKFLLKVLIFCMTILQEENGTRNALASKMLLVGAWFAPLPVSANLLAAAATSITGSTNRFKKWARCANMTFFCCSGFLQSQTSRSEEDSALVLVKLGLARRANRHPGCYILLHPITQFFAKLKGGLLTAKATIQGIRKLGNSVSNLDHLWASAFLVFGYKSEPPVVQLKAHDMVLFIKKTALPLAIRAFTTFSRCNSSLELLKVCTNVLEEVEKSFVSQIQDWCHGSLCWKNKMNSHQRIDEYVWQDVTLLKATLLETRAKLMLRGGHFDNGEELCRTCISIRTVMLGHNHAQTLAAQETLAKLVRMSSKI